MPERDAPRSDEAASTGVDADVHTALLQACSLLDARPSTGYVTPPRTNAVLSAEIGDARVLLRAELLVDAVTARERVRVVENLRAQGVPWARPVDLLEVPLADRTLPVSVWEWVERAGGVPAVSDVVRALGALHRSVPPAGLSPRFGSVSAELERMEVFAPWSERFREVEAYALRWPQERVVHGDALSVNLINTGDGLTFVDTDMLAIGYPLVDWQYLARDARTDPAKARIDWSLRVEDLGPAWDEAEPGWHLPGHPLWNAQRLLHLKRHALLWERGGRDQEGLTRLSAIAKTVEPAPA